MICSVNNLTIKLKEESSSHIIVRDISFSLEPGVSMGIVGESGSGKTITALSLLKLLPPRMYISDGQIRWYGSMDQDVDLARLDEKEIQRIRGRQISMIFQEPMTSLNPSLRCGWQIREAVSLHLGESPKRAASQTLQLLKEVQLPADKAFYNKYPHQLSGGQRQRIMIAMALAGNPSLLIADEPTTALDVTVQKKILDLLDEIRRNRGMSMLFISHDLGVIRQICDNVLVMYQGKLVESGRVDDLFDDPQHPYTRGLISCRPMLESKPGRLPTLADFLSPGHYAEKPDPVKPEQKQPADKPGTRAARPQEPQQEEISLLKVIDLHTRYVLKKSFFGKTLRSLEAVDHVSFHVCQGETLGLIGESGCGKSTLGRTLIGLIRSRKGKIQYRGESVTQLRGKQLNEYRRKVQFIFQDPFSSLNPTLKIGPSIMEVMQVHGIHSSRKQRQEAALGLLDDVGLPGGFFNRYPHEFSGGQRQRIGLARALAAGPELIICDESVSSLDVSVQAQILNLLNDLKEKLKLTYLFISHDLAVVKYMADRIMVMKDGMLVEQGSSRDLFLNPETDYTRELINSILD
jgi:peptide/nickel transport system ATP-binding protein